MSADIGKQWLVNPGVNDANYDIIIVDDDSVTTKKANTTQQSPQSPATRALRVFTTFFLAFFLICFLLPTPSTRIFDDDDDDGWGWNDDYTQPYAIEIDVIEVQLSNTTSNVSAVVTETVPTIPMGAPHAGDHPAINLTTRDDDDGMPLIAPEYVNRTLLEEVVKLQRDWAKVDHGPMKDREHFLASWGQQRGGVAVLIGLDSEEREGSDTEILFRQESNFIYTTGFDHPGARVIVGLDEGMALKAGEAWLFVPHGNAVWEGRTETLDDFKNRYDISDAFWIEDFDKKLDELRPETVYTFSGVDIAIPESAEQDSSSLRGALATARAIKTPAEIALMRAVSRVSVDAHIALMKHIKCGNYESDAESLFRYVNHNYGARFQAYIPIVGSGPNAAALHYNDNDMQIERDTLVLVDAGAEMGPTRNGGGWTTDITRTFPCSGRFTRQQRDIYDIEFKAEDKCRELCVPGSSMTAATTEVRRILVQGLLDVGILKGASVDELIAKRIYSVFMPHSLGHSVGLDVHDPGLGSPFVAGNIVTCEPGIYFIESLIDSALADPELAPYIDENALKEYIPVGGIRLEDTILITNEGPDNLSAGAPRTAAEIEAVMAAGISDSKEPSSPSPVTVNKSVAEK